jgi:hypothetical protein
MQVFKFSGRQSRNQIVYRSNSQSFQNLTKLTLFIIKNNKIVKVSFKGFNTYKKGIESFLYHYDQRRIKICESCNFYMKLCNVFHLNDIHLYRIKYE